MLQAETATLDSSRGSCDYTILWGLAGTALWGLAGSARNGFWMPMSIKDSREPVLEPPMLHVAANSKLRRDRNGQVIQLFGSSSPSQKVPDFAFAHVERTAFVEISFVPHAAHILRPSPEEAFQSREEVG